ncbi:MAG TPA: helix-turn-helix transcriptional regulator [Ktedonosporobacter sp.]|nr:helix-turn-helix transcriptional regulator [Ktedonosporobacter sp.]
MFLQAGKPMQEQTGDSALRRARRRKGLTLTDASHRLGIHINTLSGWELGKHQPYAHTRQKLCDLYEATPYELGLETLPQPAAEEAPPTQATPEPSQLEQEDVEVAFLAVVYRWDRCNTRYSELQARMTQVMDHYDTLLNLSETVDRRKALHVLVKVPLHFFGLTALGNPHSFPAEELLPHLAAGITACWSLSGGNELPFVSHIIAQYLPSLTSLAKQPSRYQKAAADLASQGYILKSMLAWHLQTLDVAEGYAQKAVQYSQIADNPDIQATSLRQLAAVYFYKMQPQRSLQKAREALIYTKQANPAVRSFVYRGLAAYQTIDGDLQEGRRSLKEAHTSFSSVSQTRPVYAEPNLSEIFLWDGYTNYYSGHYQDALTAFSQVGRLQPTSGIGERIRIQGAIQATLAGMRTPERDMERCIAYWKVGMQGAINLESEQRFREASIALTAMQCVWPQEERIQALSGQIKLWQQEHQRQKQKSHTTSPSP